MKIIDARNLALDLIAEHLDDDWTFQFDNAKQRFGQCRPLQKVISMSAPLTRLNSEEEVRHTILHEIAHAQTPLTCKSHGPEWAARCRALGITSDACFDSNRTAMPKPEWVGTCPTCGDTIKRYRLTKKATGGACSLCCRGKYNLTHKLIWHKVDA